MPALSIIIPCYNEEKRLPVDELTVFLSKNINTGIVFINDGSTDATATILETLRQQNPSRIKILSHSKKKGKGEAVRMGFLASVEDPIYTHHGFLDADLSISPDELFRLFNLLMTTGKKFILGSRIKKIGATIIRNEWRHFYSRIIATIIGSIIRLDVYDTQCSAKIFDTALATPLFTEKFKTRWLFDVEVICRIHKLYGNLNATGSEEPVLEWIEKKGSKLRWYNFFQILKEIFVLRKYYRNKK